MPKISREDEVVVVFLENGTNVDPVLLAQCRSLALRECPDAKEVAFVLQRGTGTSKSFYYLKESKGYISEKYLFDPLQLSHFRAKAMAEELWHGDKVPDEKEIKMQAKRLKRKEMK